MHIVNGGISVAPRTMCIVTESHRRDGSIFPLALDPVPVPGVWGRGVFLSPFFCGFELAGNYAHCKRGYISRSPNDVHSLWECSIFPSGNKTYNPYRLLFSPCSPPVGLRWKCQPGLWGRWSLLPATHSNPTGTPFRMPGHNPPGKATHHNPNQQMVPKAA